ncbi:hypothetical protein ACRAWD_25785 [Caulobacter segnis]
MLKFAANAQAGEDEAAAKSAITSWAALRGDRPRTVKRTIEDIEQAGGGWTFAKLTIANAALRELSSAASDASGPFASSSLAREAKRGARGWTRVIADGRHGRSTSGAAAAVLGR